MNTTNIIITDLHWCFLWNLSFHFHNFLQLSQNELNHRQKHLLMTHKLLLPNQEIKESQIPVPATYKKITNHPVKKLLRIMWDRCEQGLSKDQKCLQPKTESPSWAVPAGIFGFTTDKSNTRAALEKWKRTYESIRDKTEKEGEIR